MQILTSPNELPNEQALWPEHSGRIAWRTLTLFAGIVLGYIGLFTAAHQELMSLPACMVIASALIFVAFTVLHEAGHGNISQGVAWMQPVERLIGWITTMPFLIPFGMFARVHDYHHAFTNDPEGDPDYPAAGATGFGVLMHAMLIPMNYLYLIATRFRRDPVIAKTHRSTIAFYLTINVLFAFFIAQGYGGAVLWLVVLPPLLASLFLGVIFSWIPHMPGRQQGRYQNTRTYLFPGLKYLTLAQNYHHVHHLYPRVPWYHYERVFHLIRREMEANQAPIEKLFSKDTPGLLQSPFASHPVDGRRNKLTLTVRSVRKETPDSVVIAFANHQGRSLKFKAGQYVTISKRINNETVTRCYSICESPNAEMVAVGVKRVENGTLSKYLNAVLKAGDPLTVAGPFGDFTYECSGDRERNETLILFAGGSGITPVLSILQAALEGDTWTGVHLVYANRSAQDVMFRTRLDRLSALYGPRLRIMHIYERPPAGWQGETGLLNEKNLTAFLKQIKDLNFARFYICGPEPMKDVVVRTLRKHGVQSARIMIEEFAHAMPAAEGPVHRIKIALANGAQHEIAVAENQTVLQVANQAGIKIPHACGVGQCGCCKMRVSYGEHELASKETPGLLASEKAQGLTLSCQCTPRSELLLTE